MDTSGQMSLFDENALEPTMECMEAYKRTK